MGNIIGDKQEKVKEMYSLWLSTVPVSGTTSKDIVLPDFDKFMCLGSSSSLPFQINYSGSTTGILGKTSDTAIFVDGASGAVMNINISTERVNPVVYRGDLDGSKDAIDMSPYENQIGDSYWIPPRESSRGLNNAWSYYSIILNHVTKEYLLGELLDVQTEIGRYPRGQMITYTGPKLGEEDDHPIWIATDTEPNYYSNKKFIEKLMEMRTNIQMMDNAYVLEVYNVSQVHHDARFAHGESSLSQIEEMRKKSSGYYGAGLVDASEPKRLFVYINTFDFSLDMDNPNQIELSLNLIQRNTLKGYNE